MPFDLVVTKTAQFLRRQLRRLAALAFWANAFFVFSIPHIPTERLAKAVGVSIHEVLLGCALLAVSALSTYGFKNFFVDILYIYVFPFIFLFQSVKMLWKLAARIPGLFASAIGREVPAMDWEKLFAEVRPEGPLVRAAIAPTTPTKLPVAGLSSVSDPPTAAKAVRRLLVRVTLPFRSLTFLWCLLLVAATRPGILILSLSVVLFHLLRFLASLVGSLRDATAYLDGAEQRILEYVVTSIDEVMREPTDSPPNQSSMKTVARLGLWRSACFFASNHGALSFWFLLIGVGLYALIFIRVSLLFAFVYFGLCKLQGQHFGLLDSMIDSLTMPFSFTDFPRVWTVRMMEGVHSAALVTVGIGAIRAYVRRKLSSLSDVARQVWDRLDDEAVRRKMAEIARRTNKGASKAQGSA